MRGVIVAGGKGTRLHPITGDVIPKVLVEVGGTSVIDHQISWMVEHGIDEIFIITGHLGGEVAAHVAKFAAGGPKVTCLREAEPLGTAGGLRMLRGRVHGAFVVLYGDIYLDVDLGDVAAFHQASQADATMVVHPNDHPFDSDLVMADDDGRVTGVLFRDREAGAYANLVNAGLYVLSQDVLESIPAGRPSDVVKDVLLGLSRRGGRLFAYRTTEYIKDLGVTERHSEVSHDIHLGVPARRSRREPRPAVFLDRDGTLIEYVSLLHDPHDVKLLPASGAAVRTLNRAGYLCVVVSNQPVVARNLCGEEGVREANRAMESQLGKERAYLDDIFYCPHHPDRGYPEENVAYKIGCDCRKPKVGMVMSAQRRLGLDLTRSYLIGDTTVDVQTAANAGLQSILVMTGQGGRDSKHRVQPDFVFPDLAASADFIVWGRRRIETALDGVLAPRVGGPEEQARLSPRSLVLVGGAAQTGKSTVARVLCHRLQKRGIDAVQLSLDGWTEAPDTGGAPGGRGGYGRGLSEAIERLLDGADTEWPECDPLSGARVGTRRHYLEGDAWLIIEGDLVLDVDALCERADLTVHVDAEENTRRVRLETWRTWREGSRRNGGLQERSTALDECTDRARMTAAGADLRIRT